MQRKTFLCPPRKLFPSVQRNEIDSWREMDEDEGMSEMQRMLCPGLFCPGQSSALVIIDSRAEIVNMNKYIQVKLT